MLCTSKQKEKLESLFSKEASATYVLVNSVFLPAPLVLNRSLTLANVLKSSFFACANSHNLTLLVNFQILNLLDSSKNDIV